MIIYPALDLMGGKCVRLTQGERDRSTVYSGDPAEVARKWLDAGATWLHVVDLDAAFDQSCFANLESIRKILEVTRAANAKIQVGGGIRVEEHIKKYVDEGVARVIVGTAALESPGFAKEIFDEFGAKVALGLDSRDGNVAVKGWTSVTNLSTEATAVQMQSLGAKVMIVTDIRRDGMLTEPNFDLMAHLCGLLDVRIIVSGGVSDISHVERLHKLNLANIDGVIVGKALYEGQFDLAEAIKLYQV